MTEGVEGPLRVKIRPPGTPRTPDEKVAEVIRLTQAPSPHGATHWTVRAMGKAVGLAASTIRKIWKSHGLSPHRWRYFNPSNVGPSPRNCITWLVSMSRRPHTR